MGRWLYRAAAIGACIWFGGASALAGTGATGPGSQRAASLHWPLAFEANAGQVDAAARFLLRATGYQVFLTPQEVITVIPQRAGARSLAADTATDRRHSPAAALRMQFVGARGQPQLQGLEPLAHRTHYLRGDAQESRAGVANFRKVMYESVYAGVDALFYLNEGRLEYDFLVAPGAATEQIRLRFSGAEHISISDEGELVLQLTGAAGASVVRYSQPVAYQEKAGHREPVEAEYQLAADGEVGFRVGAYDRSLPLVIDPILSFASHLWGGGASSMAMDGAGNVYVLGNIWTSDMPASGGYLPKLTGTQDAYIAKFDPSGKKILYATYLGGRRASTSGSGIAVDAGGHAYIAGTTTASSFPTTSGAYQTTFSSGSSFLTKLSPSGNALVYSTFVSGTTARALALDPAGNAYVTGQAANLATTPGAFQPINPKGTTASPFVAKFNAAGSALVYATYLGGTGNDEAAAIAVAADGSAYITGTARSANFPVAEALQPTLRGTRDAFVTRLNPAGSGLIYSTYLGGNDWDEGYAVTLDASGHAYVVGRTWSENFPATSGVFQPAKGSAGVSYANGFIAKLLPQGNGLVYGSYLGGRCNSCSDPGTGDAATAVAVDPAGNAYVGGWVTSMNFPQVDAIQSVGGGSTFARAFFVARVNPRAEALTYAVALGERLQDVRVNGIAVDAAGSVFAAGYSGYQLEFPITEGAHVTRDGGAGFLARLSPGRYTTTLRSSVNPASAHQPLLLTAEVHATQSGGTVSFFAGGSELGNAPVVEGSATFAPTLPPGVHRLTAVYSGDGKTSPPLMQSITGQ